MRDPPSDFAAMTKYVVNGLSCFNPIDGYNQVMFMINRAIGSPNFYYFDSEIPQGFDQSQLELYKQTRWTRVQIWLSVMTRQHMTKLFIFRWILNFFTFFSEFLIRNFPFIAFFKFGFRNAYVKIT
jgi:hypothetical protein